LAFKLNLEDTTVRFLTTILKISFVLVSLQEYVDYLLLVHIATRQTIGFSLSSVTVCWKWTWLVKMWIVTGLFFAKRNRTTLLKLFLSKIQSIDAQFV